MGKTMFFTGCMLIAATAGFAQNAKRLLALSKTDHTLAVIDAVTLRVLAQIPVGPDPHEVIASADGKMAYVSNMGDALHEIDVIDLINKKAMASIDTRALTGLHGLAYVGGKVWFTAQGARAVARYDPAKRQIDWIQGTGQNRTHMIYVTPDEKHVYTTNVESGTVSILDYAVQAPHAQPRRPDGKTPPMGGKPRMEWEQTVINVSKGSEGFDVTPDGRQLWTASARDGKIWVIDVVEKMVLATIDGNVMGANRLKFTPDGKLALISSLSTGDVYIYDVASRKEVKKINTGHGAAGILVDTDGSRAFIGCTADNYVAVIDLNKMEVSGKIDVGGGPDGLAWAPEQK